MKKLRVGILFGGRSGEHEVSLLSAASVLKAISRRKYEIVPIGITREGHWVTSSDATRLLTGDAAPAERSLRAGDPAATESAAVLAHGDSIIVPPMPAQGKTSALVPFETQTIDIQASASPVLNLDVVFPVLHGTFGEDGTIQGLFELADIAYVGSGVLGSAAGMDKDVMKRLFAAAKLPIPKHVSFLRAEWEAAPKKIIAKIEAALKYPVFVKPANLGSSVGISKVKDRKGLAPAIEIAAGFDRKLVVEEGVGGKKGKARELEVAVLGNDSPEASVVGEIVPGKEFYDYEAKYLSEGSYPIIPAKITKQQSKIIREMAVAAFRACDCSGLARVDFLMEPATNSTRPPRIYLNEINTLPGFTSISMYPKLWAATGVAYPDLIDRLVSLALERHAEKQRTRFSR
jgi:D-alanine-D-alanine ligase